MNYYIKEGNGRKKDKVYYLDREYKAHWSYISHCAALSFHKSLIGLSELRELEKFRGVKKSNNLGMSRAIATYNTIYHIFVAVMLLDGKYEIEIAKKHIRNGVYDIRIEREKLNSSCELPRTWEKAGVYEQDLSTTITHYKIKNYCKKLREEENNFYFKYVQILFDNFVRINDNSEKSISGLFEKVCYVRDRTLYRPSYVVDMNTDIIQTSLDVAKEINGLPDSDELYHILSSIHTALIEHYVKENSIFFKFFFISLWDNFISEDYEYLVELGFSDSAIYQVLSTDFELNKINIATYTAQLIEVACAERTIRDIKQLWNPLREDFINKVVHTDL